MYDKNIIWIRILLTGKARKLPEGAPTKTPQYHLMKLALIASDLHWQLCVWVCVWNGCLHLPFKKIFNINHFQFLSYTHFALLNESTHEMGNYSIIIIIIVYTFSCFHNTFNISNAQIPIMLNALSALCVLFHLFVSLNIIIILATCSIVFHHFTIYYVYSFEIFLNNSVPNIATLFELDSI